MSSRGFTLLEVTVSVAILMVVIAFLYMLSASLSSAALIQEGKTFTQDQVRNAMQVITTDLRQASSTSVNWATLPGATLTYQPAADIDGNGTAVDSGGFLEVDGVHTVQRDATDPTRVVLIQPDGTSQVIATNVLPNEDVNGNGTLESAEDTNNNNALDRGLWFQAVGQTVQITIQAQRRTGSPPRPILSSLIEFVEPRN